MPTMNINFLAFFSITLVSSFSKICCSGSATVQTTILQHKLSSPLYDGIKILIADERYNAQLIWNQTAYHLSEASYVLEKAIEELSHYNPAERLKSLNDMLKHPNWQHCYKEYEREIAHFNREFISKYKICKQTLDVAAAHLENETFDEIDFIRNAALEIQRVLEICKVTGLKRNEEYHAGITLCVIAHIGQIDQRLLESSQLILDIIAEITMATNIDDDDCHAYNVLQQEFEKVYFGIIDCLEGLAVQNILY